MFHLEEVLRMTVKRCGTGGLKAFFGFFALNGIRTTSCCSLGNIFSGFYFFKNLVLQVGGCARG